jgi:two-component system phosphate regulon sensor histidine kinase PhoR
VVRLQGTYLLVILIFLLIAGLYLHQTLKRFYTDQTTNHLLVQARLILQQINASEYGRRNDELARKLKSVTGSRITLIGPDGKVWADSDENSAVMENHLYRPEVQQALHQSYGVSIRHSKTVGIDFMYAAIPIREGGRLKGFIRVALPLTELNAGISVIRRKFFYAFLVASLIAVFIGYAYSRTITKPIAAITRFTGRIAEGRLGERLRIISRDEIGRLASQVNTMAGELEKTIHLIQSEKTKVEAILKSLRDSVLVVDDRGNILSANPAAESLVKLSESNLTGRSLTEIFRNPALDELFNKARKEHSPAAQIVNLQFPREIELEVNIAPVEEEEEAVPRFIITARDITLLRKLEKMRVDFVANVSHELRSPLTAIRGFIETLQAGALADRSAAERFLHIMSAQTERLTRLLDDLLTLSNIELGKVEMQLRPLKLQNVVEECFATLEKKAADGSIELRMSEIEDAPDVIADRDRLMQILINLIDNGIKFTPPGGAVTVSARILPAVGEPATPMIEISVADTGIGIPTRDLPRISERFYRVDKARSRELGSTGLGLAIVKHLVIAHGGSFKIESELRQGTTVRITLPRA